MEAALLNFFFTDYMTLINKLAFVVSKTKSAQVINDPVSCIFPYTPSSFNP